MGEYKSVSKSVLLISLIVYLYRRKNFNKIYNFIKRINEGVAHIKEFDNRAVGTVVRKLRKQKKLSQEVVSALAGIAEAISMIETGTKQANFETLWKLAYALEITPHELVKLIEDEAEKTSSDN